MYTYANGTAALQMPSHYVPLTEDEMTYVDGGSTRIFSKYFQSGREAYNYFKDTAALLRVKATAEAALWAATGALAGVVGAIIGAVGGVIYSSKHLGYASTMDQLAYQLDNYSKTARGVVVNLYEEGWSLFYSFNN